MKKPILKKRSEAVQRYLADQNTNLKLSPTSLHSKMSLRGNDYGEEYTKEVGRSA